MTSMAAALVAWRSRQQPDRWFLQPNNCYMANGPTFDLHRVESVTTFANRLCMQ